MSNQDLTIRITDLLEDVGIFVAVEAEGDTITLSGEVTSDESRQAALDVASAVAGGANVTIVDQLEVLTFLPDDAFTDADPWTSELEISDRPASSGVDDGETIELDPDFAGDIGTTNARLAVEEGETYFPPTDPVVRPVNTDQELQIVGGFDATAMDDEPRAALTGTRNDDDIADDVRRELISDALTTDLNVQVAVLDGTVILSGSVPTIDDAENAEAVASRVAGIVEIREDLKIEPAGQ